MPHSWKHSRSGWTGLWANWSNWRSPHSLQGVWTSWPLKVKPKLFYCSMTLWLRVWSRSIRLRNGRENTVPYHLFLFFLLLMPTLVLSISCFLLEKAHQIGKLVLKNYVKIRNLWNLLLLFQIRIVWVSESVANILIYTSWWKPLSTNPVLLKILDRQNHIKALALFHNENHSLPPTQPQKCHVDHRTVWVGRDLKDHLVPPPLPRTRTPSTRLGCSKPHPTWLWIIPGRGHSQLLWAISSSASPPHSKLMF